MITKQIKLVEANLKPESFCSIEVLFIREIIENNQVVGSSKWRTTLTPDDYNATKINPFNSGEINMPNELKTMQTLFTEDVRARYNTFKSDSK